ncbi:MAG TPA: dihydroorotate dehydrogenase-like protein [Anaerolineae bacterium]|nr:dihydroorotate dehydrogenase-like protein [Anaerolineae bacterium]
MELTTTYLGLELKSPIVPSSSPLMRDLDNLRRMEDAGAGAVILHSLFEERITHEAHTLNEHLLQGTDSFAEALDYFPDIADYKTSPDFYVAHLQKAKAALDIPVIASLNGVSSGGWIQYARDLEAAGADALELNIYFLPTDPNLSSGEVENLYLDALRDVKATISIPIAMKLNPYFSALANMTTRLATAGADGLVLFNRFYQPDLDLEQLEVVPHLRLSTTDELRLPLRWIALLYGRVPVDFALTTGVHTSMDALKGLAAGAQVVLMASEILRNGIGRIHDINTGVSAWLVKNEYDSLDQLRGSMSQVNCGEPAAFERANYMRVLSSYAADYGTRGSLAGH